MDWQAPVMGGMSRSQIAYEACAEMVKVYGITDYRHRAIDLLKDSYPEIFEDLTYNKLNNHIRSEGWADKLRAGDPRALYHAKVEEHANKNQVRMLEQQIKAAAKEKALDDMLLDLFQESIPSLPDVPPLWSPSTATARITETAVSLVSDIHGFEHVSAERTRGHNVYTPEEMCRRMGNLVAAEHSILGSKRDAGWVFPNRVVMLLGDNVSGTIHELERHAHGANVVLAVDGVAWVIAQYLREVARMHEHVFVVGVGGNHGRLPDARRKQMKDPTRTWDYMIYLMLPWMLKDLQDKFTFWFPDAWAAQIQIEGYEFMMNHGDDIKSWAGIPWYGIERRTHKMLALEGARDNRIDYQVFGHFHTPASLSNPTGETFVNGCVIGGNEFALEALASAGPPKQWLLQVHEEHGVTGRWPLRLDTNRDEAPTFTATPWLDVQHRVDQVGVVPKLVAKRQARG